MAAQHQAALSRGIYFSDGRLPMAWAHELRQDPYFDERFGRLRLGRYVTRVARSDADRDAAYRLRFRVFNLELGEGLSSAAQSGCDRDEFDDVCDHLVVFDEEIGEIVGTYRLQTGRTAARNFGFYSEREFDFSPYRPLRNSILELGRACIGREHRSFKVLTLLWRGVLHYAESQHVRNLVGCSSLGSLDPCRGAAVYSSLSGHLVSPELRTAPTAKFAFSMVEGASASVECAPKLLRSYLALGAKVCGPPAMDREFGTIDFLTWLDLAEMPMATRARLLA